MHLRPAYKRSYGTRWKILGSRAYCSKCRLWRSVRLFSPNRAMRHGLEAWCLDCTRGRGSNPHERETTLQRKYGLSLADVDAMIKQQNGRCAICDQAETLVIDHCHTTGRVRGLLCRPCNNALGKVNDSPTLLRQLAMYCEAV